MPALAVDFGTSLIKVVKVDGDSLKSSLMAANPLGKVTFEAAKDVSTIAEVIKKLLVEVKYEGKKVNIVIPDSATYMSVISLPVLSDTELASSLNWEADQYVPVPLSEVELSWEVLNRPARKTGNEKMEVLLVAAQKRLIQGLVDVFTAINLEPESIESELIAATRSIYPVKDQGGSFVLGTFGASSISLGIFRQGKLVLITKFNSGGLALTRAISQSLQLPLIQAEEYKRTYGVKTGVLENRLLIAMAPVLEGLVEELKRIQGYYEQQYKGEKLGRLLMSGGSSLLPGLLPYLTEKTGLEVVIGDPMQNVKAKNMGSEGVIYAAAIGATLRK